MTQDPRPSIIQEDGEGITVSENLEVTYSEFTPSTIITTVNDTSVMNESIWTIGDSDGGNTLSFMRYINVPRKNVTKAIFSASFNIETGPINISLYNLMGKNSTIAQTNQTMTVSFSVNPDEYLRYMTSMIRMHIEVSGEHKDDVVITGFWIQAVTNMTLYPVSIDLQNFEGVSLFANPTMHDMHYIEIMPSITVDGRDVDFEYGCYIAQINETILLPAGNYTINFEWWWHYRISSNLEVSNYAVQLDWQIKSVMITLKPVYPVPSYRLMLFYGELYSGDFLLSEMPTFYLPINRTWDIYILGRHRSISGSITTGTAEKITVWIDPNLVVIGSFAIAPGRFILIITLLLSILFMGFAWWKKFTKTSQVIPYSLLVLSYILPWSYCVIRPPWYFDISQDYTESVAFMPGLSSISYNNPDNFTHITFLGYSGAIFLYLFLIAVIVNLYVDTIENDYGYLIFLTTLCEFLFGFVYSFIGVGSQITPLSVGVGPVLAILSCISWIILTQREKSQSSSIELK